MWQTRWISWLLAIALVVNPLSSLCCGGDASVAASPADRSNQPDRAATAAGHDCCSPRSTANPSSPPAAMHHPGDAGHAETADEHASEHHGCGCEPATLHPAPLAPSSTAASLAAGPDPIPSDSLAPPERPLPSTPRLIRSRPDPPATAPRSLRALRVLLRV